MQSDCKFTHEFKGTDVTENDGIDGVLRDDDDDTSKQSIFPSLFIQF